MHTIIVAGIFRLQMYKSYTAREFNRGIQAAEDTKTSFPSSPKTNFIRNSIRHYDSKPWNSLQ